MVTKWSTIRESKGASPMRRRVVYIEDATWERLRQRASQHSLTMSAVIRDLLEPAPTAVDKDGFRSDGYVGPGVENLTKALASGRLERDPFREFRPAPKPHR